MPEEQLPLRNVRAVPDLLREQTAVPGEGLERLRQLFGCARASGRQLVVRALAGEKRPRAADAGPIERCAVAVFAVTVALVAVPRRPVRRVDLERRVDDRDGAHDTRIVWRAKPEPHERERVEADHR